MKTLGPALQPCIQRRDSRTFGCFFFVHADVVLGLHLITCMHSAQAESFGTGLVHSTSVLLPYLLRSQLTLYAVMTLASLEAKRLSIVATKSLPLSAILFTWLDLADA